MKILQYRLDIRLKFPIKDSEAEKVTDAVIKKLCAVLNQEEDLVDNVETAMFTYPGAQKDEPTDLAEM
jgi:hypothetical protein